MHRCTIKFYGKTQLRVLANFATISQASMNLPRNRLATLIAMLCFSYHGSANTIVVNSDSDLTEADQFCTLREAIKSANEDPTVSDSGCALGQAGQDIIEFQLPTSSVIMLSQPDFLEITEPLIIRGSPNNSITIRGTGNARVFRILSTAVEIQHVSITNGNTNTVAYGGGIYINGSSLKLDSVSLYSNQARFGGGIGIFDSILLLNNSSVINNTSVTGGGIGVTGRTSEVKIVNSTISNNTAEGLGGGLRTVDAEIDILNTTISGNTSELAGGGISSELGSISIRNSIISSNFSEVGAEIQSNRFFSSRFNSNGRNVFGSSNSSFSEAFDRFSPSAEDFIATQDRQNIAPSSILEELVKSKNKNFIHRLPPNSPAQDRGSLQECPTEDQTGTPRANGLVFPILSSRGTIAVIDISDGCDSGAVQN